MLNISEKYYSTITSALFSLISITLFFPANINSIALIITSIWVIILYLNKKIKISYKIDDKKLKYAFIYYVGFIILNLIGVFYSSNIEEALKVLNIRIPLLLIPFIVYSASNYINFKGVFIAFIISTIIYCAHLNTVILYTIHIENRSLSAFWKIFLGMKNVNLALFPIHAPYLALYIVFAIVLINSFVKNKFLKIGSILYLLLNIYLISSKMSFIILTIIFFFYSFKYLERKVKPIFYSFILGGFLLLSGTFLYKGERIFYHIMKEYNIWQPDNLITKLHWLFAAKDPVRRENWASSIETIKKNWIYGVGTGDVVDELQKNRPPTSWAYQYKANAHNQFLEETVRLGIFGGLLFIIIQISILTYSIYKKSTVLFLFSISVFLALISESMLARNKGIVAMVFFITILISNTIQNQKIRE